MERAQRTLDLSSVQVMGVLNVTPDSFSDGGRFDHIESAMSHARSMIESGAQIIDVGGESTRPGASPVSVQQELDRVCPIVERLVLELDAFVSVDTSKPEVMRAVLDLGAGMINDVRAFQLEGALDVVIHSEALLCLMHMQGTPATMQSNPHYDDLLHDVAGYLDARASVLLQAGVDRQRLIIDPGFGFGKTLEHNLVLLEHLDHFVRMGFPVLAGISRKSMLGLITGKDVESRMPSSVAAAVIAASKGANMIRVHDVDETVDAIKVVEALRHLRAE